MSDYDLVLKLLEPCLTPDAFAAVEVAWRGVEAENERLRQERDEAEDFRAEIVIEAFTAPDAEWNTILDSLRARIRDALSTEQEEGSG